MPFGMARHFKCRANGPSMDQAMDYPTLCFIDGMPPKQNPPPIGRRTTHERFEVKSPKACAWSGWRRQVNGFNICNDESDSEISGGTVPLSLSRRRVCCTCRSPLLQGDFSSCSVLPKRRLQPNHASTASNPSNISPLPSRLCGPPGFAQDISSKVPRVVILDHHKTAIETLGGEISVGENVSKILDIERSGATIAFDYFKDKLKGEDVCVKEKVLSDFDRVRRLFEYIEDGDLWKWTLPNSKAFSSGLKDLKLEFDVRLNTSLFDQLLSLDLDSVISQGLTSLAIKQRLIQDTLDQSYEITLGGGVFGRCLAVNVDAAMSELRSELGHQLATKSRNLNLRGVGAIVYKVPELENGQMLKISLRSIDTEDTTPISQEFGGGGHRNASSFMLNSSEFERWKASL